MEDIIITAQLTMLPEDLQRLRAIDTGRTEFIDACTALLDAEARVQRADEVLVEAVWGQTPDGTPAKQSVSEKQRLLDKLAEMSSLHADWLDGGFLLENRGDETEIICLFGQGPTLKARLVCTDERVRGERDLALEYMDIQQRMAVLKGQNGEDPDMNDPDSEAPFWFAVIIDLNGEAEQDVAVSIEQGSDDLIPCEGALDYLRTARAS